MEKVPPCRNDFCLDAARVGQRAEVEYLNAVERKDLHIFVRGDQVQRGEAAVDVLHPHQPCLLYTSYLKLVT